MVGAARPRVLLLGGVDPSGGAGITWDAQVVAHFGGHPLAVPVALTVQNRSEFRAAEAVAPDVLERMVRAVVADGPVAAVKTGLFADAESLALVGDLLEELVGPEVLRVVDPVLGSTAGGWSGFAGAESAYLERLVPGAIVTPNLPEAARLGGPERLFEAGARAVALKGGHGEGQELVDRWLPRGGEPQERRHPRLDVGPVRGTGCAFASALAALAAGGESLPSAWSRSVAFLQERLVEVPPGPDGLPSHLQA